MPKAGIALGSNLGDRPAQLIEAIQRLGQLGTVLAVSGFFDTTPVGFLDQPRFLNAAALLETERSPHGLLRALLEIERGMGRRREDVPQNGPRTIDLDLLFYDDEVMETPELTLPHPRMHERSFVLTPLVQVAAGWRHPLLGRTVDALLESISRQAGADGLS